MPGLVGIVSKMPHSRARAELSGMVDALRHERFYVSGTWMDPAMGIYVGWTARAGSFGASMPVSNETDDITLIFSGEDYPEPGAKLRLRQRGHSFEESGPSYLVHAYEEENADFFANLNGIFHGLLADRKKGTATLFNDRFGMLRLYGYEANDAFYFAAEAKAIHSVRPESRSINQSALGEFASLGCVLQDRTLFNRIRLIPAASKWTIREGAIESKEQYFRPSDWESLGPVSAGDYYRQLRDEYVGVLPRYLNGGESAAVALTGGLDTRLILAWSNAQSGSLPCYTFGGSLRESADVRIAKKVAAACGQPHHVIAVGEEFLESFPRYASRTMYLGEGTIGVANAQDLYISEQARSIATAKVVGTWGSELLRQAVIFKPARFPHGLFVPEFEQSFVEASRLYDNVRTRHPVTFTAFLQTQWYQYGIEALEQTQLTVRAPFLANDVVCAVYRAPSAGGADVRPQLIEEGNPSLSRIPSDRGVKSSGAGVWDTLNHLLQEFTFKAEYACDMGMPQWFARLDKAVSPIRLDRLFLGRHKYTHYRKWYKEPLSGFVQEILLDPKCLSRPHLKPSGVEAIVRSHIRGDRNYTNTIHTLLSLELLHRAFE